MRALLAVGGTMRRFVRTALSGLLLAVAATAAAFTIQELQSRADSLSSTYESLYSQASGCTGGTCSERAAIEAALTAAEADRGQLHSDRATMGTCGACQTLDSTISSIDDAATTVAGVIEGWSGGD